MIIIREILEADYKSVATLSDQLGYNFNPDETLKRIIQLRSAADHIVFVSTINDKVVGWIHGFYTIRIESDPFVEIGGLIVDIAHRNQKIGKLLIEQISKWAKKYNANRIKVRCNTKRLESHLFYERIGFKLEKQQMVFQMDA